MTPEERKAAARRELARRELAKREAANVSRETSVPDWRQQVMRQHQATMAGIRNPDWAGMAQRADDLVRGAAEGATLGFADEIAAAADTLSGLGTGQTYEENLAAQRARDVQSDPAARLMGNVGGALMTGRAIPAPTTIGGATGLGAGLGGVAGFGAGEGGLQQRLREAGPSALMGAGLGGGLQALARVISPQSSQAAQDLMEAGVRPTPGQALGGGLSRAEEKLVSAPFLGSAITQARQRALESFNRAVINKAISPAGLRVADDVPVSGRQAYNQASSALGDAYESLLNRVPSVRYDMPFARQLNTALTSARANLSKPDMDALGRQIRKVYRPNKMGQGQTTGKDLHEFISDLKGRARNYQGSSTASERELGQSFNDLVDVFDDLLQRNMVPDDATQLMNLRRAYASFMPVENAVSRLGAKEGVFSPEALRSAVRATDDSLRKRQFARGGALMQEMAEQGVDVLGREVPNSGTAERVLTNVMLGGAAMVDPTALALGAGAAGASLPYRYTPLQNMMLQAVAGRQGPAFQQAGQAVGRLAAPASLMAPAAATSLLGP